LVTLLLQRVFRYNTSHRIISPLFNLHRECNCILESSAPQAVVIAPPGDHICYSSIKKSKKLSSLQLCLISLFLG